MASGRAGDSYWLQVKVRGQEGWLAGDLVKDQGLLSLLPRVETPQLQPPVSPPPANRARIYTGIGNTTQPKGEGLLVTSLVENGPAQRAGLQVGDIILAIDGPSVSDLPYDEALNRIRGPKGVAVTLSVLRPGIDAPVDVTIVRDEINLNAVAWTCQDQPIRGFGNAWQEHPETHKWLGCPFTNFRRNEHATAAAVQTFEHGWMLWLETDTVANVDPIYVIYHGDFDFDLDGETTFIQGWTSYQDTFEALEEK